MTTVGMLLCRGQPHRAELASAGLRCLVSLTPDCVAQRGGFVVLQHDLKLATGCAGSGASQEVQVKVSHCLCPAWCYPGELQSDLQMATDCAGLGSAQESPSHEQSLASSAIPGAT